jgi:hypothetical protein
MNCPKCGKENSADAIFCSNCGRKLSIAPGDDEQGNAPGVVREPVKTTSGKAIAGLVCGIIGVIPFPLINFMLGVLALVFSSLARSEIKKDRSKSGAGLATAGLVLGIVDFVIAILLLAAIVIPNIFVYQTRAKDSMVKNNMYRIQVAMEDFSTQRVDMKYPLNADSKTDRGESFESMLKLLNLNDPFTRKPAIVTFKGDIAKAPSEYQAIDISPGDIYVFSDGLNYLILGGDRNGASYTFRLSSGKQ